MSFFRVGKNKKNKKNISYLDTIIKGEKEWITSLRERVWRIEIRPRRIVRAWHKHKPIFQIFIFIFAVIIFSAYYSNQTRATITNIYSSTCLGGWNNPENAEGAPDITDLEAGGFNTTNSAVLKNSSSQIFCGGFNSEVPIEEVPKKLTLHISWLVTDEEIKEPTAIESIDSTYDTNNDSDTSVTVIEENPNSTNEENIPTNETTPSESQPEAVEPSLEEVPASDTESQPEAQPVSYFWNNIFHIVRAQEAPPEPEADQPQAEEMSSPAPETQPETVENTIPPIEPEIPSTQIENTDNNTQDSTSESPLPTVVEEDLPQNGEFLEVLYTLDGEKWETLGRVSRQNWQNASFEIAIPFLSWDNISKVQISLKSLDTIDATPIVYLDSMWLEVESVPEGPEVPLPEVLLEDSEYVTTAKKDYGIKEEPVFTVSRVDFSSEEVAMLVNTGEAKVVEDPNGELTEKIRDQYPNAKGLPTEEELDLLKKDGLIEKSIDVIKSIIGSDKPASTREDSSTLKDDIAVPEPTVEVIEGPTEPISNDQVLIQNVDQIAPTDSKPTDLENQKESPVDVIEVSKGSIFEGGESLLNILSRANHDTPKFRVMNFEEFFKPRLVLAQEDPPVEESTQPEADLPPAEVPVLAEEIPPVSTPEVPPTAPVQQGESSLNGSQQGQQGESSLDSGEPVPPTSEAPVLPLSRIDIELENFRGEKTESPFVLNEDDAGNFKITLSNKNQNHFEPGPYRFHAKVLQEDGTIVTLEKDFVWGVLAINTNKSVYEVGEEAYLQMASLNQQGHTICNTKLELKIVGPDGLGKIFKTSNGTIVSNSTCGRDNVTDEPDYFAHYTPTKAGVYKMTLKNLEVGYSVTDSFTVKIGEPFSIERVGATRINPFKASYVMHLKVTAKENFNGNIEEVTPADFVIINSNGGLVMPSSDEPLTSNSIQTISWPIDLSAGETTELSYEYQAPPISPELYILGPAKILKTTTSIPEGSTIEQTETTEIWREAREWKLASDVAYVATKTANWNDTTAWTTAGYPGQGAGDTASIGTAGAYTMTVTANPANTVTSVTFAYVAAATAPVITVNTGVTLTISGAITRNSSTSSSVAATLAGAGAISAGSMTVGTDGAFGVATRTNTMTVTITSLTLSGQMTAASFQGTATTRLVNAVINIESGTTTAAGTTMTTETSSNTATVANNTGAHTGTLKLTSTTPWTVSCAGTCTTTLTGVGSTVEYSATGAVPIRVTGYDNLTLSGTTGTYTGAVTTVNGTLTLSNAVIWTADAITSTLTAVTLNNTAQLTTGAAMTISGGLTINNTAVFTTGATNTWTLTVQGATSVTGTLTLNNTGAKTFGNTGTSDAVTINSGGAFSINSSAALTFKGGFTNNAAGTITVAAATSFTTNGQTVGGTGAITFSSTVTITGAITVQNDNTSTVTITGALDGSVSGSTWKQGNTSTPTLSLGSATKPFNTAGTLNASTNANTVNYTAVNPTCAAVNYSTLNITGTGTITCTITSVAVATSLTGAAALWTLTASTNLSTGTLTINHATAVFTTGANTLTLTGTGTPLTVTAGTMTISAGSTVDYSGAGITCYATTYVNLTLSGSSSTDTCAPTDVTGTMTVSGGISWAATAGTTLGGNLTLNTTGVVSTPSSSTWVISGNLTVTAGTFRLVGGNTFTLTGTASITGTVDTSVSSSGTKTFSNNVTVNSGGTWNLDGQDPATSFAGDITASSGASSFNNGNGAATWTASKQLAGAVSMTFGGTVTINSGFTLTNNNSATVTVTGAMDGGNSSSKWLQGSNTPTLSYGSATKPFNTTGVLDANTNANTVTYTAGSPTCAVVTYSTLNFTGNSGTITCSATTVNVATSITGSSTWTLTAATNLSTGTLTINNSSTTFATGANTLTLTGTGTPLTRTAGTFTASAGSTVIYSGSGVALCVSGCSYVSLTLSGGGTVTGAVTTVTGTLSMSSSTIWSQDAITSTLTAVTLSGTAQLTTGANMTISGALTVGSGTSFTTGANYTLDAQSTTDASGTLALSNSGAKTFTGLVTVASTGSLTTGTGTVTFNGGLTVNSSGSVTFATNNPILNFGAALTNNKGSSISMGTSTTTFTATGSNLAGNSAISFGGGVTINSSTTTTNANTNTITITGTLTLTGNWTQSASSSLTLGAATATSGSGTLDASASTNTVTYTASSAVVKGATYDTLSISSTASSAGTVTVNTSLEGAGTLTNTGTLNIGGTSGITGLDATTNPNTVNYTKSGNQTVKDGTSHTYHHLGLSGSGSNAKTMTGITTINGDFTMSGTATATTVATTIGGNVSVSGTAVWTNGAANVVTGTLTVGTGAKLTMDNFALTITSTTSLTGTIDTVTSSHNTTKTFTGLVTINSGGAWDLSVGNPNVTLGGGLARTGTGTFSSGSGTYTTNAAQTISQTDANTFTISSISNTATASNGLTFSGAQPSVTTLTQGTSAVLTFSGTVPTITTLTATASPNTVQYTGGTQTVKGTTYHHLTINGSGTATLGTTTIANGTLTVTAGTLSTSGSNFALTAQTVSIATAGTLNINNSTLSVTGTSGTLLTRSGSGVFTAGATSTVDLTGNTGGTVTINSGTFDTTNAFATLTSSGTGLKTLGASITINNNFNVSSGTGIFADGGNQITGNGTGTLTLASGAELRLGFTAATTFPTSFTTFSINSASTVTYQANAAQTISSTPTYGNLTLAPQDMNGDFAYTFASGTVTINGNFTMTPIGKTTTRTLTVTMAGAITVGATKTTTVDAGTLGKTILDTTGTHYALSTGLLSITNNNSTNVLTANNSNITLTGTSGTLFTVTGTFTEGGSTVIFNGDGAPTLNGNTAEASTFNILQLTPALSTTNRTYAFGTTALSIAGNFDIKPTDSDATASNTLTVNMGADIVVAATGTTTIQPGATNNPAAILDTNPGTSYNLSTGFLVLTSSGSGTGTLDAGSSTSTITLTGTSGTLLTRGARGVFTAGTSTVVFNPDASVALTTGSFITTNSFYNLTLNPTINPTIPPSRTYTLNDGAISIDGDFLIQPSAASLKTLNVVMGNGVTVAGTKTTTISAASSATSVLNTANFALSTGFLNISNAGGGGTFSPGSSTVTLTGSSSPLFTRTGTFTQGTSNVTVSGQSGSVTLMSGTATFHILTINPGVGNTVTAGASITFSDADAANKLDIQSGKFNDGGSQINGSSNGTLVMATSTELCLGSDTSCTTSQSSTATTLPTFQAGPAGYSLNSGSTVSYMANKDQTVDSTPSYGTLQIVPVITSARVFTFESGAPIINGSFTINPNSSGTNLLTVNMAGNILVAATGTTTITKTGSNTTSKLVMRPAGSDYTLSTGLLNIATGGTLDATSTTSSTLITLTGTSGTLWTQTGSFDITSATSTVVMNPNASVTLTSNNAITFYNLSLTPALSGGAKTYTLGTSALAINGNFDIKPTASTASQSLLVNMGAAITVATSKTITIQPDATNSPTATLDPRPSGTTYTISTGHVDIESNGTLDATGVTTAFLTVSGNWTNNGTYTAGSSTVTLSGVNQSLTGNTTFYNLTKQESTDNSTDSILTIAASSTQTVTNTLDFDGLDTDDRLNLVSSSPATRYTFDFTGAQVATWLDVRDSNASTSSITCTDCLGASQNNDDTEGAPHWIFVASGFNVEGFVLQIDESTGDAGTICDGGLNLTLRVNGASPQTTTCNSGTGAFTFTTVSATSGDIITIYSTHATQKANTVYISDGTADTGINVYWDTVALGHQNAGPIVIDNLAGFDNNDNADMLFTAENASPDTLVVEDGIELHIETGMTFTPGGTVTTSPSTDSNSKDGDIHIVGTLTMGANALSVGGDFNNVGTLTALTSGQDTTFAAVAAGHSITDGGANFEDIIFDGAGGEWSFANSTILNGDMTMTNGTLNGTNDITVNGGDVIGDAAINLTGGTFLVDGAGNFGGTNTWNFYALTFGNGSGATTTTAGSSGFINVASTMTIATSQVLSNSTTFYLEGNYTNNGTYTSGGTDTIVLNGSVVQTLSGTLNGASSFFNLTVQNNSADPSVIFSGPLTATGLFDIETASASIRFNAGSLYTFNDITWDGQATGTRVKMRSSVADTRWNLNVSGTQSVDNTDAKDSDASYGSTINALAASNLDSGNNINWNFLKTVSLAISDTTVGFGSLSSSVVRFANGGGTGSGSEVPAHTLTASTNAPGGYVMYLTGPTLTGTGDTINAIGGTPATSSPGTEQFGFRMTASGGTGAVLSPYNDGTPKWAFNADTGVSDDIASESVGDSVDTVYTVYYMANTSITTLPGSYSTTLTYTITSTF